MPKIAAIIFDLDGTLINTFEHIVQAFEKVLPEFGANADRAAIQAVIGKTLQQCYESLAPGLDHNKMAQRHHEVQQTTEMYALIEEYEGLRVCLAALDKQGIKKAIVTNRSEQSLHLIFDHLKLSDIFEVMITPQQVTQPKPNPAGVQAACKKLGVAPGAVLIVGDTDIDIETGKNAGILATVGLTHGFGTKESLKAANPDYIIDSLSELQHVIKTMEQK